MNDSAAEHYTEDECAALFASVFPQGFAGQDVLQEIAPDGWEVSPFLAVFHPSLEQVYAERLRMHRNLQSLTRRDQEPSVAPEPRREAIASEYAPTPVETEREVGEIVGQCLWDIFSHNHDVVGPDGRLVHIGSFRGAGGFIADCLNRQRHGQDYDYVDFYMGTIWIAERADLTPVYCMIFRRLKAHGLDWTYAFPRIYMLGIRPSGGSRREDAPGNEEQDLCAQDEARERHLAEMQESLDIAHRAAVREAMDRPLPPIVQAYEQVYGHAPGGWPPEA